jgi:hypothetical protein
MKFALWAKQRRGRSLTASNITKKKISQNAESGASSGVPLFLQPTATVNSDLESETTEDTEHSNIDATPVAPLPNVQEKAKFMKPWLTPTACGFKDELMLGSTTTSPQRCSTN